MTGLPYVERTGAGGRRPAPRLDRTVRTASLASTATILSFVDRRPEWARSGFGATLWELSRKLEESGVPLLDGDQIVAEIRAERDAD